MADASSMAPALSLKRSPQSGTKNMTAGWQVVYTQSSHSALAYLFGGASFNLSNMALGDTINIRIRQTIIPGGAFVNHDEVSYVGVQPASHPAPSIGAIFNTYGVEISMQQTTVATVLLAIEAEFYDAKRLGSV